MAIDYVRNIISSGYNLSKINDNFVKIQEALQDGLSRSGNGPNQMSSDIDLNDNDLLNVKSINVDNITYRGETLAPQELVLTNALSKEVYDPLGVGGNIFDRKNQGDFDTEASFTSSRIPSVVMYVTTGGYYSVGDGGGHTKKRISTPSPIEAWHKQSADGSWWEVVGKAISPKAFGAKDLLIDPAHNSTGAIQNAITFIGEQAGGEVVIDGYFGVDTIDLNYSFVELKGLSEGCGFKSLSAVPMLRSLLANRIAPADQGVHTFPAGSMQGLVITGLYLNGDGIGTLGTEFERITRGCVISRNLARNFTSHGFQILQSFSFVFKENWGWNNGGWGLYHEGTSTADGANAYDMHGNHFTLNGLGGVFINKSQAGFFAGNTSEYNLGPNLVIGGKGLTVIGNYFEGFGAALTGSAGQQYQVILGTDDSPFLMSKFHNYVNGGSVSANSFFGDGIALVWVVESEIIEGGFATSTRYEFVFDETWTCIGNIFKFGFTSRSSDLSAAVFRNITTSTSGGIEVLKGSNCYNNTSHRSGDTIGIREESQIAANGSTASIRTWRVDANGQILFNIGKDVSSDAIFRFNALDDSHLFHFNGLIALPERTTTQINAIASPKTGTMVRNTTTGEVWIRQLGGWHKFTTTAV